MALKYHQDFSTEHPVKGESVSYRLALANEAWLPLHCLQARFKAVHPFLEEVLPDFSMHLPAGGRLEREYRIHCPFRGIYTVGLESLEAEDSLGLLRLRRRVWHRTFYVYPRVLMLRAFSAGPERSEQLAQGSSVGAVPDFALFAQLRRYRRGEPLRHVAWKKFAATGTPFLKEFDTSAQPGVSIYFDLRETGLSGRQALQAEDVSMEILVALVRYYLDRGIPLSVRAPGRSLFGFQGSLPSQFQDFYASTMKLIFQPAISPAALYRYDMQGGEAEGSSAILVTHRYDPEVFALLESSLAVGTPLALILNQSGHEEAERRRALPYLQALRERGAAIRLVRGTATILEDLEGGSPC
jgi:hypothetical protein